MLRTCDMDSVAAVASDRHAELLAYAKQHRRIKESLPEPAHEHRTWQWLHDTFTQRLLHGHSFHLHAWRHAHLHR